MEETVWENHEQCEHSYDKRCHKSYTTAYTSVQVRKQDPSHQPSGVQRIYFPFHCRRRNVTRSSARSVTSRWWTLPRTCRLRCAGGPW